MPAGVSTPVEASRLAPPVTVQTTGLDTIEAAAIPHVFINELPPPPQLGHVPIVPSKVPNVPPPPPK